MGLGHDTVLDMLVGVTTRRLLVCQATELGDPDRAALVELVDDYLGESAELLPAWSASWESAREAMPNRQEALLLFLNGMHR